MTLLNAAQRHRGPDHAGHASWDGCCIGNTRLAIQDLSPAGNQPLVSDDGRYLAVFNGEVYNFKELRAHHHLAVRSGSDSAVILPLWAEMGPRCLSLLAGMWALAVLDRQAGTLTLARDPFGIKPLFVRRFDDGSAAFASELRALAALGPEPVLDRAAIVDFLRFGAVGATTSPYADIEACAPNRWATYDLTGTSTDTGALRGPMASGAVVSGSHPYTSPTPAGSPWNALQASMAGHLVSDVPTALLLSAGVDSSLLALAAGSCGHRLDCFTVRMPGGIDESADAAVSAARWGHRHHVVEAELSADDVEAFFGAMQRPTVDGLNTFLISKAIHQAGFRVALSGLGGDEAVAGYPHMRAFPLVGLLRAADRVGITAPLSGALRRPKLAALVHPSGPRHAAGFDALFRQVNEAATVHQLVGDDEAEKATGGADVQGGGLRALIEAEVATYLQRTLLPDADTFSMHWSVEVRVPFLDLTYFRAAAASARPFRGKGGLVRLAGDDRVTALARRPKRGFSMPMARWISDGPLREAADSAREPAAPVWDVLDRSAGLRLLSDLSRPRWAPAWSLVVLDQWLRSCRGRRATRASA